MSETESKMYHTLHKRQNETANKYDDTETEDCEHDDINWDSEPDFCGTHGMSMYWFGECEDCGIRVRERYISQGVEVVE